MKHRIGIIMGRIYKKVDKSVLNGILEQAVVNGFETYIFTVNEECANPKIMNGENNLFSMINFELLDGVIYVPYSFASAKYGIFAEEVLKANCKVPVVRIGAEHETYPSVWVDDEAEMEEIVDHLIQKHDCKKILCLTGPEGSVVSENRADGYRNAMKKVGLEYSDTDVIYGDFWLVSGKKLADELADGRRKMPDAVVCANDAMAITLCDALKEKGISVPDDIRITGYDGYLESRFHVPSITTYISNQEQLGREAFCKLYSLITNTTMLPCRYTKGELVCQESCGCSANTINHEMLDFDFLGFERSIFDNNLSAIMFDSENLDDFFKNAYIMIFTFMSEKLIENERISICLCDDWDHIYSNNVEHNYRTEGYSENMLCVHQKNGKIQFPLKKMKPEFADSEQYPVTIFNALHFLDHCFGYICFESKLSVDDYNRDYVRYIREVNNGLKFFCEQNELKRALYREKIAVRRNNLTGLFILSSNPQMLTEIKKESELYRSDFNVLIILFNELNHISDTVSTKVLDEFLMGFADYLQKICNPEETLFQINEYSFAVITTSKSYDILFKELSDTVVEYLLRHEILQRLSNIANLNLFSLTFDVMEHDNTEKIIETIENEVNQQEREWKYLISNNSHSSKLIKLRQDIYMNPEYDWNIEYCVDLLNVSRSYLHRIYSKLFNTSVANDIKYSRLSYSKYLLNTTDYTLQVIAEKCRFDYFNFMRMFKKETGMTPTDYRRRKYKVPVKPPAPPYSTRQTSRTPI